MFLLRMTLPVVVLCAIFPRPMTSFVRCELGTTARYKLSHVEPRLSFLQPLITKRQLVVLRADRFRSSKYGSGGLIELKLGLAAAQLLSASSSERTRFAKELGSKYPLLPEATIYMLLDLASTAFQSATPEELRGALTPGRLDAERPALRRKLGSRILEATPVAYMSFLPDDYKRVAAEALVDIALDGLMMASGGVLLAPEVRLYALEQEVLEVRRELGWFRCLMFRLRQRKWRREAGYQTKETTQPRKRKRKPKSKPRKRQPLTWGGLKSNGRWPWQRRWQKRRHCRRR